MAMLAEPRRKQKIGPNPRGKFFQEDEDNKGRTLLQKLGWQSGNGLGRQNQGMSAPICPKIQMDGKGLGYDVKNDPWVVHNEEFAQLLGTLEAVVPDSQDGGEKSARKKSKTKVESNSSDDDSGTRKLEKKSKASRFRIHYHKFIKNKDVSNFSTTDLSCIFGQPTDSLVSKTKKSKSLATSEDTETIASEIDVPVKDYFEEDGLKVINGGSMSDYFSSKMKEREQKAKEQVKLIKEETPQEDGLKTINGGSMIDYFKSMMAKRRLKAEAEAETDSVGALAANGIIYEKVDEADAAEDNNSASNDNNIKSTMEFDAGIEKNKVRELKRKVTEVLLTNGDQDDETDPIVEDDDTEISKPKKAKKDKKKKKKSKSKSAEEEFEQLIEETAMEVEVEEEESPEEPSVEELLEARKAHNFAKKEKRKNAKKRKMTPEIQNEEETESSFVYGDDNSTLLLIPQDLESSIDEPKVKKSKKNKKKKSKEILAEDCEQLLNSSSIELEAEVEEPAIKEKSDKKKRKGFSSKGNKKNREVVEEQENSDEVEVDVVPNEDVDEDEGDEGIEEAKGTVDTTLISPVSTHFKKVNKKKLTGEQLKELSLTYTGANLHQIRGYAYY